MVSKICYHQDPFQLYAQNHLYAFVVVPPSANTASNLYTEYIMHMYTPSNDFSPGWLYL